MSDMEPNQSPETTSSELDETLVHNPEPTQLAAEPLSSSDERVELEQASTSDVDDPKSVELSTEFVGRWSNLISTTNWEKGKIIFEWREALMGSESPASAYSDEAWSDRVGGVTPQHVGRLRRVYERFSDSYTSYPGVYWSHFLAALDWHDAEMWLEGAVQSKWSVSQMRRTRWEATGGDPALEPAEGDIVSAGDDEDFVPLSDADDRNTDGRDKSRSVAEGPRPDGPDFGDEADLDGAFSASATDEDDDDLPWNDAEPPESPFVKLPSLPVDVAEALEQFKLAIIRHRSDAWAEVAQDDVIRALDALKSFAAL